ncbi:MAG TPA: hypothetical protein VFL93_03055 [Longimicrobiaceae bacterium]|nr:hypothetical protein [Longimicrobiaceae bacterium]
MPTARRLILLLGSLALIGSAAACSKVSSITAPQPNQPNYEIMIGSGS